MVKIMWGIKKIHLNFVNGNYLSGGESTLHVWQAIRGNGRYIMLCHNSYQPERKSVMMFI